MREVTKGPWSVVDKGWQPWPDAVEINAGNEVICFTGGNDALQQKANARLIAAAPDLLAALKALLSVDLYADGEGLVSFDYPNTSDGEEAVQLARAAIDRAEGRTDA